MPHTVTSNRACTGSAKDAHRRGLRHYPLRRGPVCWRTLANMHAWSPLPRGTIAHAHAITLTPPLGRSNNISDSCSTRHKLPGTYLALTGVGVRSWCNKTHMHLHAALARHRFCRSCAFVFRWYDPRVCDAKHIAFGLIHGQDGRKLSSRSGEQQPPPTRA